MKDYIVSLDLGTTNIKAGIYDDDLVELATASLKVDYETSQNFVEFDAGQYWQLCKNCITEAIGKSNIDSGRIVSVSLTGQAETLVVIGKDDEPSGKAISWMDTRSEKECANLKRAFDNKRCYMITGQPDIVTTWPITKILWIKNNQKSRFDGAKKFLMLKDFIAFKLTGRFVSEYSVSCFTYYFDLINKKFWKDMIDYAGFSIDQLPELLEPGENIYGLTAKTSSELKIKKDIAVNIGMLDHFSGMLGAGNIGKGTLSESTGTVLALASIIEKPDKKMFPLPFHYGPFVDTYTLLPVCESGGVCLEWFKETFYKETSFNDIDIEIENSMDYKNSGRLIFLPYILGSNSPEFDPDAKGVFFGIRSTSNKTDFARAVLEGIGFMLNKNVEFLCRKGIDINRIISTGGGSKSGIWNRIKADITNKTIYLPDCRNATLLGASIYALAGLHNLDYSDIVKKTVKFSQEITPNAANNIYYREAYNKFKKIYKNLEELF
jgi:xylulokinase